MLGIADFFCGSALVIRIEVSNNLSGCSFLLLLFLSDKESFNLIGRRHSNEACALHKLLDILLLDKVIDLLISSSYDNVTLNLSLSISRITCSIHPAADNLSGISLFCDTCSIRTNNLLFTNDFFLINSSGFRNYTRSALRCIL